MPRPSACAPLLASLPLLLLPAIAQADRPPGELIDPAVTLDLAPSAFDTLTSIASGLIPAAITIPDVRLEGSDEECVWLLGCWNWYEYLITTSGLDINVSLSRFDLVPQYDRLRLDVEVLLTVASRNDPGSLYAYGEVIDLISVEEDCDVWLEPTPIGVSTSVFAELTNGAVDFNILPIDIELDVSTLRVQGCVIEDILDLIEVLDDILDFFGFDIYEIVANAAEPLVENQINNLLPELEQTLEGAFTALTIEQEIDVNGSTLTLGIEPTQLQITPDGMRLGLAGSIDPGRKPHPCVSRYVTGGSLATPGGPPELGADQAAHPHMLGVFADDDLVNQGLWAAWYAGALCFSLDESATASLDLPIALDTSLISLMTAGAYNDLFPTASPIVMEVRPTEAPVASFNGDHDINATLAGLGLDMYGELDGRFARIVGIDIGADAGVDLSFDNVAGEIEMGVAFDPSQLDLAVTFNDLRPEASAKFESGLGSIVDTIVGPLLDGLTSGLTFPLPAISGLGLTDMLLAPAGAQQEHLGMYASIGTVTYVNDAEGGCTSGCEGAGCVQGGRPGAGLLWAAPLAWLVARRRRA
jgi:hypothetical protein